MTFAGLGLMGGLALGLASSLHCLGMCGGIVSSLMLAGGGRRAPGWAGRLARLQGGRVLAYSLLGALCGGLGGAVFGHLAGPVLFLVLRSVAALSLGWVGLTLTGLAPRVPLAERGLALGAAGLRRVQALVPAVLAPVLTGMIWGLMPCGMVYGALAFALVSGSALGGGLVMAGFGLGTLLPVSAAGAGVAWLGQRATGPRMQAALGVVLMGGAAASLWVSPEAVRALCGG